MKKPYTINFHSNTLSDQSVDYNFAQYCLYPISFAHTSKFVIPQATLLNQYCRTFLSYAELYEIQAEEAFTASVEMHQQQLFLLFMLEGCIRFKDDDGHKILELQSGNYCSTFKREGNYHTHFKGGTHRFLVISYRHDWSKRIAVDYPHLNDFFESFEERKELYYVLPPCKISRQVSGLLYRLSKQSAPKTKGELGAVMKRFISKVLAHYNDQILTESYKISIRAKIFIDTHYHDSELTIEVLTNHLFTTSQTLRANFKKDFGKTPKAYLIEVRMRKAHHLLKMKDLPIHKVCRLVGYDDAKNFGLQFKKFFGYPPSKTKRV